MACEPFRALLPAGREGSTKTNKRLLWAILLVATAGFVALPFAAVADPVAKIGVCHVPPGNPDNRHEIAIGRDGLAAHLEHGDYLAPCDEAWVRVYEEAVWGVLRPDVVEAVDIEVRWLVLGLPEPAYVRIDGAWDWALATNDCAPVLTYPVEFWDHIPTEGREPLTENTYWATVTLVDWATNGAAGRIDGRITGGLVCAVGYRPDGTVDRDFTFTFEFDGAHNTYNGLGGVGVVRYGIDAEIPFHVPGAHRPDEPCTCPAGPKGLRAPNVVVHFAP